MKITWAQENHQSVDAQKTERHWSRDPSTDCTVLTFNIIREVTALP